MRIILATVLAGMMAWTGQPAQSAPLHGIAMHGEPALPAGFPHFPYVNPDVKKGGRIAYGVVGTFDNLNPFILKSMRTTARGMWDPEFGNLIYESLMQRSRDEPFTMYGLIAETVEWDEERTFIQFNLNPKARFADGQPVTADDVIFSFELLRDAGRAPFSRRLEVVERMEKVSERSVRFVFNDKADRESPMLLALAPVLPKHAIKMEGFDRTSLEAPLGSGPYKVKAVQPGRRIVFERDENYWAKDLPSKIGFDNYDEISVEYFLQENTLFEAFKKGEIDVYAEGNPTNWDRGYNFPDVTYGSLLRDVFKPKLPSGMLGFVFNTRKPLFRDVRVRKALSLAFDFEWVNRNLFAGAYKRTESFWQNSDLSSLGVPASEAEKAILGEDIGRIEPDILDGTYRIPVTDGSGRDRKILKQAVDLLKDAGYRIVDGRMRDAGGVPLSFEIMTQNADQEKLALAYQRFLTAIGVTASVRTIDDSQYQSRTQTFDYDVILKAYGSSLSPGIEQVNYWGSQTVEREGSSNFAGVADPVVDRVIEALLAARKIEDFSAAVRLHDRMLLSGHYVVPLYHLGEQWVARWKHIGHPEETPLYGYQFSTWWDERVQ